MGDLLGFKGVIVNFVVRHVKKMVPAFSLPRRRHRSTTRSRPAASMTLQRAVADAATTSPSCNTPAAPPACRRARRCSIATSSPTCLQNDAWLQPAIKDDAADEQLMMVCALPLYHIFALTACFLLAMRAGGSNLLIPNPRDIPRLRSRS